MLLFKGSFGHVESSFDNPAKNFPVKLRVFLVKVQEKRKTNFSWVFFDVFPSVHFDYCFDTPEHIFTKIRENSTQNPKRDDASVKYFYHFFSKFCWGHVKFTFSNPAKCQVFSQIRFFRSETKKDQTIILLSKKNIRTFRCTRRLHFWEILTKKSRQKSKNFAQRTKNLSKVSSFQGNVLNLFLWTLWM